MITPEISLPGRLLARSPRWLLQAATQVIADVVLAQLPGWRRRRRIAASNLHHAFPERTDSWRRRMIRCSVRRTVECVMLSLAMPYLTPARLRRIARIAPSLDPADPRATVFAVPHTVPWLVVAWLKLLARDDRREFGVFFEPTRDRGVNAHFRKTYQRFGVQPLAGTEGMLEALRILRGGGWVGAFFDQDAGEAGVLSTLFGRLCMTPDLPVFLATQTKATLKVVHPRRCGFWRAEIEAETISPGGGTAHGTVALNRWLEQALASDDEACAGWYWTYDRWKSLNAPSTRFRLNARRSVLPVEAGVLGRAAVPQSARVWVTLPDRLDGIVQAVPVLRALQKGRPDTHLTLVAPARFHGLLELLAAGDRRHAPPGGGLAVIVEGLRLRRSRPDLWLLLDDTPRSDWLAWLTGAPLRFGVFTEHHPRPRLTHGFRVPPVAVTYLDLWEALLQRFGLEAAVDRDGLWPAPGAVAPARLAPIALFPGATAGERSRWSAVQWRELATAFPAAAFMMIARPETRRAAEESRSPAGESTPVVVVKDFGALAETLRSCRLLVTESAEAVHLANALGIPVIALGGGAERPAFRGAVRVIPPADGAAEVAATVAAMHGLIGTCVAQPL